MITRQEFAAIDAEIKKAIQDTPDNNTSHGDHVLWIFPACQ